MKEGMFAAFAPSRYALHLEVLWYRMPSLFHFVNVAGGVGVLESTSEATAATSEGGGIDSPENSLELDRRCASK